MEMIQPQGKAEENRMHHEGCPSVNIGRGGSWPHYDQQDLLGRDMDSPQTTRTGVGEGLGLTGTPATYPAT